MKVLLDHCVPHSFAHCLPEHEVEAASDRGWQDFDNGRLLQIAKSGGFQVLLTVDQNLRYQQNLQALALPVVIVESPDTRVAALQSLLPVIRKGLALVEQPRPANIVILVNADGCRTLG